MSEAIKHECGIVLIRLLKPLSYYKEKYGRYTYGLEKLYLMMEKQHNRGQEGAGVACVKIDAEPGCEYIFRERALGSGAISEAFAKVNRAIAEGKAEGLQGPELPYIGELYIGHLRYSTTGRSGISYVHPFLRRNNWRSRNLCLAGNFNLTNVEEIFDSIVAQGQHPRHNADTFIMLEQLGYLLDSHHEDLYRKYKAEGLRGRELSARIEDNIDMEGIISTVSQMWDGGFVIVGATGSGESFVFRDRWGIRPAHYYADDEIVAVASERAVIQTVMNITTDQVRELGAGEALVIHRNGEVCPCCVAKPENPRPCSFERIYFSRGSDGDIYKERKALGRLLTPQILREIDHDIDHAVFSFIPNTAEVAYYGMMEGLNNYLNDLKISRLIELGHQADAEQMKSILNHKIRTEKLAIKDIKLRTFIAEGSSRNDLATHVYDITYDTIVPGEDSVVVIDDSIVRGTTLKQSIVKILSRLDPRKIVVVSSSPQIRYPDCYGIDMSRMSEFIAFNAAIELLKEHNLTSVLDEVYRKCKESESLPTDRIENYVKKVYAPFTDAQIADKIARMITPEEVKCEVKVIYQTIENLHKACPRHPGDWYFSGNYPTPGGTRLVNRAFVNYYEGNKDKR
ncbi:MAG: amidophosphoribosyltransferase [Rikenellaceae bacterium]|nr:amidophosphoribosyltransferase [Rikenellaceae bacterium]